MTAIVFLICESDRLESFFDIGVLTKLRRGSENFTAYRILIEMDKLNFE